MAPLSLKIILDEGAVTRKVKFDNKMTVSAAHHIVKDKVIVADPTKEYALFLRSADDELSGIWMEPQRTLDYYMLRDGDSLEYICKVRNLRIKLLDGSVKTLQVNEGKSVSELMITICGRLGITNHDEYGLCPEEDDKPEESKELPHTGTKSKTLKRDRDVALEQLSKKLNTDDNVKWLDQHRTLRELGVESSTTVILKRRLFYSDRNVDARDPVQLNLLYVQTRDAILNGRHLVTEEQASEFAGIQCQIQLGDFQEEKHKPGFIENLKEYLPETYLSSWGIEKKLLKAFRKHQGLTQLEAKNLYIRTARELPTYGVTFFLVKEKQKDKKKLVPRLLGINAEAILRLDENSKEILQQWPLTHVKTYHVGKSETFTLNFGDYSDKEYSCKTQDAYRIRDILEGYIDIIRRRMLAKPSGDAEDSMAICHDNIHSGQINIIQHVSHQPSKLIKETFVGPNRIIAFEQGSTPHQGTQIMTMQQMIQTNKFSNPQTAVKGEVAVQGDMSSDCVRKLKRMNSNSVKIVTLLTDPNDTDVKDTQKIVANMKEDLVVVEMGVKATAQQQTIEESRKMLLNEMQDLVNYVNKLYNTTSPGHVDTSEAKDVAEKIAHLTSEMCSSQDPKSKRRSELLNRSRKSFRAGEKMDDTIRRASFIAAASGALGGVERAKQILTENTQHQLSDADVRQLRSELQDRLGKLNAALALYLTAYSDPNNVDYAAAIDSMNNITTLVPKIATDGQNLSGTQNSTYRQEMLGDLDSLFDGVRRLCSLTGTKDHDKVQEASNNYADVANKLLFTFSQGRNVAKENEIIELAKDAGAKTSLLLMSANELAGLVAGDAATDVDTAGVRSAGAASDLLACVQLTAPAIHEPHCQSALTAAAEGLSSSVHRLSSTWKPLVEDPAKHQLGEQLHQREMDVHKALERLKDAYVNLNADALDEEMTLEERQRLKYMRSLTGAKNNLQNLKYTWDKPAASEEKRDPSWKVVQQLKEKEARQRLADQMALLNAAIAELATATADLENPDYGTAELALNCISELMPQIVKDMEVVSVGQEEATRNAMQQNILALCEAVFDNVHHLEDLGQNAAKYSTASSRLMFLISPSADKATEKREVYLATAAYDNAMELLSHGYRLKWQLSSDAADDLAIKGSRTDQAARSLVTVAQIISPTLNEARCSSALASSVDQLRGCASELTATCHHLLKPGSPEYEDMIDSHKRLEDSLQKLLDMCPMEQNDGVIVAPSAQQEKKRLCFIKSMSDARNRLDDAEKRIKEPLACVMMREEDGTALQRHLSDKLAQLNAALVALSAATADREKPDYETAQRAVDTINELMPQIVQDACVLSGTKGGDEQKAMLEHIQKLCDASKALCDSAADTQGLQDAAAKVAATSGKLVFFLSPAADHGKGQEIIGLSAAAHDRASELVSLAQVVSQTAPEVAHTELDEKKNRTAVAAQALLTTAQLTAPMITSHHCSDAMVSATEHLRSSTQDLTAACRPYIKPGQQERQMQDTQQQLQNSLEKLLQACHGGQSCPYVESGEQQAKQRLCFVNSLSGAKSCFDNAQSLLKQPVPSTKMPESDALVLQRHLSDRLAQLNAAVAALAAATADRERPDYAAAQRAVEDITALMPQLVQEAKTLSATKDGADQKSILQQLAQVCDASRAVCESAERAQGFDEAAAEFAAASGQLMYTVSPATDHEKEEQIIDLSSLSCVLASELLSHVKALTQQLPPDDASELDSRGVATADAAQDLLSVAQVTASSMSSPHCQKSLESAVERLRGSADELSEAYKPHVKPGAQRQQLDESHKQLLNSLDKLLQACRTIQEHGTSTLSPAQQEKQRIDFIRVVSTASTHLYDAEKHLNEPLVCPLMKQSEAAALQHQLGRRLGQINMSVAELTAATNDYKYPDYPAAERSIITITELMPKVIQESKKLSCTKDDNSKKMIHENLNEIYGASCNICNNADDPKELNEASLKLADSSSKLVTLVRPEQTADVTTSRKPSVKKKGPAVPQRAGQKPAVPDRNSKTVACAVPSRHSCTTQDFLNNLRSEESYDNAARVVAAEAKCLLKKKRDQEKCYYDSFLNTVDNAQSEIKQAHDSLKLLNDAKQIRAPGVDPVEVTNKEQSMEDTLARAAVEVAALVSANYSDKLEYKAAMEPIVALTHSVRSIVEDGSVVSSTLQENSRKAFLIDLIGLCDAASHICDATRNDNLKLNAAAILFGDHSAKLLRVVCADINPDLEKEVITRAKAIGDSASRLALEASNAASANSAGDRGQAGVQNIRALGIQVVDAAGKLVYTAKLVAPTIHHSTCQDALVSSADTLSSNLTTFTNTWTSLASDPHTSKLTEEAKILEKLLENLKTGVKSGRLGSRKEVDGLVMLDTPLRQMTVQIVDNARNMAEFGELQPETKQEYKKYIGRLEEALRALDLANARFQRAPHDKKRRNEMEIAIQDLQVTLLQTRPAQVGQEKNNIIDFRDFLQGLVTEADHLTESADKNQAATGKRVADDIKLVCNKISEDAKKLMNPVHHGGDDSFDDIMEIYEFGEDCDLLVKELNAIIGTVTDQKARTALHAKLLPLVENSNFLRFATNSALSTAKSAAYDVALQDLQDFDNNVIKALVNQLKENKKEQLPHVLSELLSNRAQMSLLSATSKAKAGEPQLLCRALTDFTVNAVADRSCDESEGIVAAIDTVYKEVRGIIETYSMRSANFEVSKEVPVAHEIIQKINKTKPVYENLKVEVLKDEDANKLLVCQRHEVEGTRSQLEEKFQQLSTMLCSMSGSIFLSVKKPESLSRSLHATADAASQLASTARALKDDKKPVQSKKIEDASLEMCLATYSLLKISELLAQNPDHHDTRRKLLNACQYLNETINMLNRAIHPTPSLSRECSSLLRGLQLQRSALQSSHQPVSATTYTHCIEALQSQRDVLNKLNSDQAMSREDFLKSMLYVTTVVGNTTECAAHATYLLAASEKDKEVALEGVVDVAKMHKSIGTIHDTCVSVILYRGDQSQLEEIKKTLEKQVDELLKDLDDSIEKTKDQEVKELLQKYRKELDVTAKAFYSAVDEKQPPHVTTPVVLRVAGAVRRVLGALERPALVPRALAVEPARQELCDQLLQYTITLVSNTQDLIKEVKSSPEQSEMRWSSYEKRREVLAAFDALLKKIKSSGQDANILEADMDDAAQNKSYIQIQTEKAFKWLHKPMAKSDVKANGQVAVKNLIDVGRRMSEDLSGADKEDLRHLVDETEQIFSHCCKKYDQEQYGLLMDRIRELQKAIERMAVTRLVEDFMDTEEPLADLDILADAERDEKSRQFILERKIAELLAQLGRVSRTARYIADTGAGGDKLSTKLTTCSQQTELLAPMLVKAAEQRIQKPDDQVAVDNYRTLLAKYTESLSKVRDLCDQSVDPMDFVQTASETMQKMREDSTKDNDPRKCAYTSSAITRLANRVIHVGLSSSSARDDPELGRALEAAKRQLSAATPAPDTRASKMPDWKDTTAKILHATGEVESVLAGETIFKKQPDTNQPIYNEALNLHVAIRDWSSRDNEIVAVAKRMAVLMAKLSEYMNTDKQREVLTTSKSIVSESHEVARLAKKLAHECTDHRIKTNLLQVCSRIPTISGQLKMLTTVKGSALGHHGTREDQEAMDMLVGNAQSLMISIQDVVKAAASASVKIMSQRGPKIKWVRKTYY